MSSTSGMSGMAAVVDCHSALVGGLSIDLDGRALELAGSTRLEA